jgi:FHS family glucose/mannose:H+ symporter-like MFS transporter
MSTDSSEARRRVRLAYTGIFLSLAAFGMSVNGVFPLITKLADGAGFPFSSFGTILFVQFGAFSLTSFAIPKLVNKHKKGTSILVAWGLAGLWVLLLVTPLLRSYLHLHLWAFFLGVSGSSVETGCSLLITDIDKSKSGRMMNLSGALYCAGAIAAPQIVAVLLSTEMPWKASFVVLSTLIGIIALVFVFTNLGKAAMNTHHESAAGGVEISETPPMKPSLLALLFVAMFFYTGAEAGMVSWLPSYFEKHHHLSVAGAALRLSLFWGGLVVGRMLVFWFSDKLVSRNILFVGTWGMAVTGILFIFLDGTRIDTLVVFGIGLAAGPVWPCIVAVTRELGRSARAASYVIGAGALGVAIFPLITGWMIRDFGFTPMFTLLGTASTAMAACISILYMIITVSTRSAVRTGGAHEI